MEKDQILIELDFATPAYDECLELRNQVLRIPLGLSFSVSDMLDESDEFHFGLYNTRMGLLACASFRKISDSVLKMRQVVVHPAMQRTGIGSMLVNKLEIWAGHNGYKKIELHARDIAVKFYKKLDYKIVGKPFEEVGIPHRKMQKTIS
jgi:predicted GNAT family N-acyltransferase